MNKSIEAVLYDFAGCLGVDGYDSTSPNMISVDLERSGTYCIESLDDGAVMYLSRRYIEISAELIEEALTLCGLRSIYEAPLRVGLAGKDRILFSLYLSMHDVDISSLYKAHEDLNNQHEILTKGAHT